ncbi:MAG: phage tail protein [Anaerolineaceae bacterium]|nr:phage tail protein [Anaerolineaceae bacterium]
MAEAFIGEIRLFAFNTIPSGWALCNGQLLNIFEHTALYSLIGNAYGGDGRTTFGLPDMRGRVAVNQGQSPGASTYLLGQRVGVEKVKLTERQMPSHKHELMVSSAVANSTTPVGNVLAVTADDVYKVKEPDEEMMLGSIATTGESEPIENRMPYLALCYCIAMTGIMPEPS